MLCRLLLTILFKVICQSLRLKFRNFERSRKKRDFSLVSGGKVDIKDIVWPGEVMKPPEGEYHLIINSSAKIKKSNKKKLLIPTGCRCP